VTKEKKFITWTAGGWELEGLRSRARKVGGSEQAPVPASPAREGQPKIISAEDSDPRHVVVTRQLFVFGRTGAEPRRPYVDHGHGHQVSVNSRYDGVRQDAVRLLRSLAGRRELEQRTGAFLASYSVAKQKFIFQRRFFNY